MMDYLFQQSPRLPGLGRNRGVVAGSDGWAARLESCLQALLSICITLLASAVENCICLLVVAPLGLSYRSSAPDFLIRVP